MIDRDELAIELQALLTHLRSHQPDALVSSYLAHADAHQTVMQVTVTGSNDVQTGAHASAPAGEASAEIAENRALLRVLIAMGIPPVEQPRLRSVPAADSSRVVHFPRTEAEKAEPVIESGEPEDISWTAFWKWAREHGFRDKAAVEAALGRSMNDLLPAQIRVLLEDR